MAEVDLPNGSAYSNFTHWCLPVDMGILEQVWDADTYAVCVRFFWGKGGGI